MSIIFLRGVCFASVSLGFLEIPGVLAFGGVLACARLGLRCFDGAVVYWKAFGIAAGG